MTQQQNIEILDNFSKIPKKVLAGAARMRENAHTAAVIDIYKSSDLDNIYRTIIRLRNGYKAAHESILTNNSA